MNFYRYVDGEEYEVCLKIYVLTKETPAGHWIQSASCIGTQSDLKRRWVSKTSLKRFAYPTKKQALESYMYRKRMQILIYSRRLKVAEEFHRKAISMQKEEP